MFGSIDEAIDKQEDLAKHYEDFIKNNIDEDDFATRESMMQEVIEPRQLAEWLRELKELRKFTHFVATHVMADDFEDNGDFYAEVFCRRLNKLNVIRHEDNKWVYDEEVKADDE